MSAHFQSPHVERGAQRTPSNRSFGLTVGGILAALGLIRVVKEGGLDIVSTLMLGVGGVLVLLAIVWQASLTHANRAWMGLGALMSRFTSPVVLFLMYAVAFVPTGLAMRLFGYDPLRLKAAPPGASYWIERRTPDDPPRNMLNQF